MVRHLPNILSALRLALAPVTAWLIVTGEFTAAFAVFVVAGATDALDGWLAKKLDCPTTVGKFLDPAADKLLMLAAFLALAWESHIPSWIALVVILRDLLIAGSVGVARIAGAKLDTTPMFLGKLSTVLQVAYVALHLAALAFGLSLAAIGEADAYIVAAITSLSGGAYLTRFIEAMTPQRPA
jgi:cardiolipin synthase (CMP-forming)